MFFSKINKYLKPILIVIIVIISCLYLLRLISDPDFFWHLKTGEWIWQNKSLPSEDPFAYTTPPVHSSREKFILTSYWLSQLTYYLIYLAGGLQAIIISRFIVIGILIYVMLKLKKGDSTLYLGLLIIFLIVILSYPIERPQVFSLIFFAVLLYLLEKIKVNAEIGDRPYILHPISYALPLLMLIWANMHGGHVLGQITIVLYIVMEGIKFKHPSLRPIEKRIYKRLFIAGTLSIIFSLANPNTYHAIIETFNMPAYTTLFITEYYSTLQMFRMFNDYSIILYWFILFLTITGSIINIKKIDITEVVLLGGLGLVSFFQTRYKIFFLVAALPVVRRYFSDDRLLKLSRVLILVIAILACVFFSRNERNNLNNVLSDSWIDKNFFPVDAAEFIVANNLEGNMYNRYYYGGYLIWRLAPERKVFIDGRYLYEDIYMKSQAIAGADGREIDGMPVWKFFLGGYGTEHIIIPYFQYDGTLLPLADALLKDRDWIPVFFKSNSIIFVKESYRNYDVIKKYSIPRHYIIDQLQR